jgi:hypothetical protein
LTADGGDGLALEVPVSQWTNGDAGEVYFVGNAPALLTEGTQLQSNKDIIGFRPPVRILLFQPGLTKGMQRYSNPKKPFAARKTVLSREIRFTCWAVRAQLRTSPNPMRSANLGAAVSGERHDCIYLHQGIAL